MENFTNPPVSVLELPKVEEQVFTPLDPKLKKVMLVNDLLYILGIICIAIVLLILEDDKVFRYIIGGSMAGMLLLVVIHLVFMLTMVYKSRGYAVREKDITYKRGAIFQKTITIPFKKVQQVEVVQGLAGKIFHLYGVQVINGGQAQSSSGFTIEGLKKEDAESLRAFIIERTIASHE